MSLNIAYFGTPEFSARFLEKILNDPDIDATISVVVTQPDKPTGRAQEVTPSAVKQTALAAGIPVVHAVSAEQLQPMNLDLAVVYAYGKIIPADVLAVPTHGFWNIHPSLLPYFRGASPTAYTLLMGEEEGGCTLMQMDAQMDHGPIIAQDTHKVSHTETHHSLLEKLTYVGYYLFKENFAKLMDGTFNRSSLAVQNDSIATYTRLLKRDDGFVELSLLQKAIRGEKVTSEELPTIMREYLGQTTVKQFPIPFAPYIVFNLFRGMQPWPGMWTSVPVNGTPTRMKILDLELAENALTIKTVQLEGKTPVTFEQFNQAYQIF